LSLEKAASHLLEECRMVLPGVQALLGFQLIAVFNAGFRDNLSRAEQFAHLVAILFVVVSVAMIMSPAAIHRMREPMSVSSGFVRLSSRLLMFGMAPLAVGTAVDVYLVARIVSHSRAIAGGAMAFAIIAFVGFWVLVPLRGRLE
jgi:hypothetical protein